MCRTKVGSLASGVSILLGHFSSAAPYATDWGLRLGVHSRSAHLCTQISALSPHRSKPNPSEYYEVCNNFFLSVFTIYTILNPELFYKFTLNKNNFIQKNSYKKGKMIKTQA
jgi:hypothetical protein